jgi:methionyl-tRNA formyltransferase
MSKKYKIIFAGTSEFAVPSLNKLSQTDFIDLALVITQPDKPVGRKKELQFSPIKIAAQRLNLNLVQPNKIIEIAGELEKIEPDLGIVVSYGQIIPPSILDAPKMGWLNLHPSLLPKYRGSSPIQNVILNNETETGLSLMRLDNKMDHGPLVAQTRVALTTKYNFIELSDLLATKGAQLLIDNLKDYLENRIELQNQNDELASFTKIISKEDGRIDWQKTANEIDCQIRAYLPWPGSYTFWNNKRLKIIDGKAVSYKIEDKKPGQIFIEKNQLFVTCKNDALEINKIQLEGKAEMETSAFIRGYAEINNQILG